VAPAVACRSRLPFYFHLLRSAPMAPTDRDLHRIDKHTSGEHVTYSHFESFMEEFRNVSRNLESKIDNMSTRLTEVQVNVAGMDKDLSTMREQSQDIVKRADTTSAAVKALEEARKIQEALDAQAETLGQPKRAIKEKVVELLTTALVLGTIAIGYNLLRDSMIKEVATGPSAHAPHTP
jgi:TolA-binding protein